MVFAKLQSEVDLQLCKNVSFSSFPPKSNKITIFPKHFS